MKTFSDLTEQEIIALAISSEDDDARAYAGFAHALQHGFSALGRRKADLDHVERENNGKE